ncbi:N-acetyltransferase 9 [Perkinsus chesapeaki]|uniref:N-acetyltransferase 9 n=1 Tax=Perkinsus chesapeaki TaxID=330153 RepID=A0A7J6L301_PERCH|nr:N-acetyltransferase 9 [Perkinsus chesapeaki]
MRVAERLEGEKCILVPYTRQMVDTYHSWMVNSQDLREETESELLTPEEEYDMQKSWEDDSDKLIFIVLDKSREADAQLGEVAAGGAMCGDVDCFISDIEDDNTPGHSIRGMAGDLCGFGRLFRPTSRVYLRRRDIRDDRCAIEEQTGSVWLENLFLTQKF